MNGGRSWGSRAVRVGYRHPPCPSGGWPPGSPACWEAAWPAGRAAPPAPRWLNAVSLVANGLGRYGVVSHRQGELIPTARKLHPKAGGKARVGLRRVKVGLE